MKRPHSDWFWVGGFFAVLLALVLWAYAPVWLPR